MMSSLVSMFLIWYLLGLDYLQVQDWLKSSIVDGIVAGIGYGTWFPSSNLRAIYLFRCA